MTTNVLLPPFGTLGVSPTSADVTGTLAVEEAADLPAQEAEGEEAQRELAEVLSTPPADQSGVALQRRVRWFGGGDLSRAVAATLRPHKDFQSPHVLGVNGLEIRGDRSKSLAQTIFEVSGAHISLREILTIFSPPLPGYLLSYFDIARLNTPGFGINVAWVNGKGEKAARYSFRVQPGQDQPGLVRDYHSDMYVDDRQNGIGAILLTQHLLLLKRLGFKRLEIAAGLMGRYYWPSRGFDFGEESLRVAVLKNFEGYVEIIGRQNGWELSPAQRQTIRQIKHAWELAHLTLSWGEMEVPVGKRYLQNPMYQKGVMVSFELRGDYEGWQYLRQGLAKIGQAHLLPASLGGSSASPASPFSLRRQSAGSMENVPRK